MPRRDRTRPGSRASPSQAAVAGPTSGANDRDLFGLAALEHHRVEAEPREPLEEVARRSVLAARDAASPRSARRRPPRPSPGRGPEAGPRRPPGNDCSQTGSWMTTGVTSRRSAQPGPRARRDGVDEVREDEDERAGREASRRGVASSSRQASSERGGVVAQPAAAPVEDGTALRGCRGAPRPGRPAARRTPRSPRSAAVAAAISRTAASIAAALSSHGNGGGVEAHPRSPVDDDDDARAPGRRRTRAPRTRRRRGPPRGVPTPASRSSDLRSPRPVGTRPGDLVPLAASCAPPLIRTAPRRTAAAGRAGERTASAGHALSDGGVRVPGRLGSWRALETAATDMSGEIAVSPASHSISTSGVEDQPVTDDRPEEVLDVLGDDVVAAVARAPTRGRRARARGSRGPRRRPRRCPASASRGRARPPTA